MNLGEKQMPAAFYPHGQHPGYLYTFIARYSGDPNVLSRAVTKVVGEVDPNLPVANFKTMGQVDDETFINHRVVAQLCSFFGLLAALLACIGIYGLMSYGVTRRTNEFGVRLALGADRQHVVWLVLRETLGLLLIGLVVGLALAPAMNRLVASFLFGVKPYDPLSIGLAMVAMITVALLAGYLPARRAARIDPGMALRYE